jgi:hypothetical protein
MRSYTSWETLVSGVVKKYLTCYRSEHAMSCSQDAGPDEPIPHTKTLFTCGSFWYNVTRCAQYSISWTSGRYTFSYVSHFVTPPPPWRSVGLQYLARNNQQITKAPCYIIFFSFFCRFSFIRPHILLTILFWTTRIRECLCFSRMTDQFNFP